MTWLGRLNRVLRLFHVLLVRVQLADSGETVRFVWMMTAEFKRRGGKFE
jgi:hypothetical protein